MNPSISNGSAFSSVQKFSIVETKSLIKNTAIEKAEPFEIDGFGHFGKDVIFMNVELSNAAKAMHDRLIDAMSEIPYIHFSEKDGKDKNFHVTIASKQIKKIFDRLYEYVNQKCCIFDCSFDNVTIFKWGDRKWDVYRQFTIPN